MTTVRAFYRSTKVPGAESPYDTLTLKVFYPADPQDSPDERNTGVIPPLRVGAPFPVMIFLPGINCGPESYQWLAIRLAEAGIVSITFSWIAEEMPGYISLTPGMDFKNISPDTYGAGPTSPAIAPILDEIASLNKDGLLQGLLDEDRIILGGHSAGGTMALQNLNADWFPTIQAAFSYGGHTMASTMLGFDIGTILPIQAKKPVLIIGGSQDDVIASSTHRYGLEENNPTIALERTFEEAVVGGREDSYLLILDGGTHFSCAHPIDHSTGRAFLEQNSNGNEEALRNVIGEAVINFIHRHVTKKLVGAAVADIAQPEISTLLVK